VDASRMDPQPDESRTGAASGPVGEDDRFVVQEEVAISLDDARRLDRRAGWARHNWGYVLAVGVIAVVFGAFLLGSAFDTLSALLWVTGLYLIFMGAVQLLGLGRGGARGMHLLAAAVAFAGGLVLLLWPGETLKVIAVVGGITFLLYGVVEIVASVRGPAEDRLAGLARGAGLAVLGVLMIVWPGPTVTLLGVVLGLITIVWGASVIVSALSLRKAGREWEEMRETRRNRPRAAA
jgi:hypothetical protein